MNSELGCEKPFGIMEHLEGGVSGNSNIFYVHPEPWGVMIQFDEHMFQMGWFNHQQVL